MKKLLILFLTSAITLCSFAQNAYLQEAVVHRQVQLPYNRLIQPAGFQIFFGDDSRENHALDVSLSPDRKWLAVEERYSIVIISTSDNTVKFTLENDDNPDFTGAMNTYSGITWYTGENGPEVFWSLSGRNYLSYLVSAKWDGIKAEFNRKIEYKPAPRVSTALPNEFVIIREDGKSFIYVVLNGNNDLIKHDLATGDTIWTTSTGVAPYGITYAAGKLYVTNWAGRHPGSDDSNVAGVPWGKAKVDNENAGGATREGSVAVVDPATGKILKDIVTGLHPNEIISSKDGNFVYVTNSNSDNISVIRTSDDAISETISVRLQPEINPFFGDSPNGLALSADNKTLYVANGLDNAIAVVSLGKKSIVKSKLPESKLTGFIPVGVYPSAIALNKSLMYVCNLEGAGIMYGFSDKNTENTIYNAHYMPATLSVFPLPKKKSLKAYTDTVIAVNNLARATMAREKPREDIQPKPVPERIGEPSVFKHVVYIIKENRTYDQILGDMEKGNGDPGLCIYGDEVTPNHHKLAEEFILIDNFHASGKSSAEGHQWTDASIVTDYIEKNMRAWFRSYAHVQNDALVYAPTGFLWDNALKNNRSVRIYGEASVPVLQSNQKWSEIYKKYLNREKVDFYNYTTIEPVKGILSQTYPSYGNHEFSDVMRADALINELHEYESKEGDQLPELMIIALPNDHTAGTRPGYPTPRAMVADNDLALGRIVEAFSKSRFWKNSVIFVVEDDSQGGWDHVSPYRTVSYVISPYSRLKNVNHTYYTQPSMVRTIEQILGMLPMNIQDAIANPMSDCFLSEPDLTPYAAIPNRIPIDEMNPEISSLNGRELHFARKSMLPVFDGIDSGKDDLLNRILWFDAKGHIPYPSKYAGADIDYDEEEPND
ncbi:MAG TPA: alkaline phosphatase family protein [Bacteroidales bacterium]|nr:alkaline phosphatase family protein [Bacteroidales bacterium]